MDEQLKIVFIIIVSVSIFGLIVFVWVKNYMKNKIDTLVKTELKKPIELVVDARTSGGILVAAAKTKDGGTASVRWDAEAKSWVDFKGFSIGKVLAADPAPPSSLKAAGIHSPYKKNN